MERNNRCPKKKCRDFNIVCDRVAKNHSTLFNSRDFLRGKVRQVLFQLNVGPDKEREQVQEIGEGYMLVMPAKNDAMVTVLVQKTRIIFHFTVVMEAKAEDVLAIMQNIFTELEPNSFKLPVTSEEQTA